MSEDAISGFFLLLVILVLGLIIFHGLNPKNRISRGLEAFWNTPAIKQFRMFIWKAFWVCFLGFLPFAFISWYFEESGWYPRQRGRFIPLETRARQAGASGRVASSISLSFGRLRPSHQ